MEDVAHRTVVQDHDFAKIRLHLSEVFDVCAVAESAVLTVVSAGKVLALDFQPVDDWIGVLLNRGRENNQIVPF